MIYVGRPNPQIFILNGKQTMKELVFLLKMETDASVKLHPHVKAKTSHSTKVGPHESK